MLEHFPDVELHHAFYRIKIILLRSGVIQNLRANLFIAIPNNNNTDILYN